MVEAVNNIPTVDERVGRRTSRRTKTPFTESGGMRIPQDSEETVIGSRGVNFGVIEIPTVQTQVAEQETVAHDEKPMTPEEKQAHIREVIKQTGDTIIPY